MPQKPGPTPPGILGRAERLEEAIRVLAGAPQLSGPMKERGLRALLRALEREWAHRNRDTPS